MGIVDDKKKVFGQIGALRTLTEGFPDVTLTNSFPSLNNEESSLDFLIDLLKSLIGFEEMKESVVDVLTYQLRDIELEVKKAIKLELKSIVSCGVDPSLPDFIKSTGVGVNIRIDKVDFLNLMKINPAGPEGKFVYDDYASQLSSEDFNTFLYYTIQNTNPQDWGSQTLSSDIFTISYIEDNGTDTNMLNMKAHPNYDNKKLTDLNNDYIDSISIFGSDKMLTNIIDGLFGTLTSVLNKSQRQLEEEEKINNVIESIINMDDNKPLSDNFFTFSNEQIQIIEDTAKNRRNGIRILNNCESVVSSVPVSAIESYTDDLTGATNDIERKEVISDSIENMASVSAISDQNVKNDFTIKLNFIELLIRRLMTSIVNFIVSPKIIMIFLVNYKIIYGQNEEYSDAVDFLKQNKGLIRGIVKKVRDLIISILLKKALKAISELVAASAVKSQIEKANNNIAQLLSLVGVPQSVIRMITNLT
jgi:hypothetical protein